MRARKKYTRRKKKYKKKSKKNQKGGNCNLHEFRDALCSGEKIKWLKLSGMCEDNSHNDVDNEYIIMIIYDLLHSSFFNKKEKDSNSLKDKIANKLGFISDEKDEKRVIFKEEHLEGMKKRGESSKSIIDNSGIKTDYIEEKGKGERSEIKKKNMEFVCNILDNIINDERIKKKILESKKELIDESDIKKKVSEDRMRRFIEKMGD